MNGQPLNLERGIPPSFDGSEWGYLFALFGLLMVTLLTLNWLWRVVWSLIDDRHALCAPITVARVVIMLLLLCVLMSGTPDAFLLLQWPELSADARLSLSRAGRALDGLTLIPFAAAWLLDYLAGGVIGHQLRRLPPPPAELWPRIESMKRPAKIAAGSLAIAFAVVFLQ